MLQNARLVTLLVIVSALTASAAAVKHHVRDNSVKPNWLNPDAGSISPGQSFTVTVGFNQAAASDTTVSLSSNDPNDLSLPSTITLHAGDSSASFAGQATIHNRLRSTTATLTASCNGGSASNTITIN